MQAAATTLTGAGRRHAHPHQATELPDDLASGTRVGPWIVDHELGRGGMSTVYAVRHHEFGKRAALKLARRDVFGPRFTSDRFLLEARVVNTVDHADVVDIFDTGVIGNRPYLVMERLAGQTLGERLDQGPIDLEEIAAILLALCDILTAAHRAGVVHRDVKLDNVFLTLDRGRTRVKLLDWGLANLAGEDPMSDMIAGTPHYVAPEQVRGEQVTGSSDIYSLGVLAYVLFLGRAPFEAATSTEILSLHVKELPPPPSERWAEIPPALERLILAMLEKDPADRPSMPSVISALRAIARPAAVPPPLPPRRQCAPLERLGRTGDHGDDRLRDRVPTRRPATTPVAPADVVCGEGLASSGRGRRWLGAVVAAGLLVGALAWRVIAPGHIAAAATAEPVGVVTITVESVTLEPITPSAVIDAPAIAPSACAEPDAIAAINEPGVAFMAEPEVACTAEPTASEL